MPINPADYPADWPQIRQAILERAGHHCEHCGVANHVFGWRDRKGAFHPWPQEKPESGWIAADRLFRIVLTIAHLDHDVTNNEPANLQALCQRCHLTHDASFHARNAAITRRRRQVAAGQAEIEF